MLKENLVPVSRRRGEPFTIILLDVDHFKQYNDTHGHSAGDELLVKLGQILNECSRDQDLVVRYGGEEFMLVLPSTNAEDARILANRISGAVREKTDVTISAGLAMQTTDSELDDLIQQADDKLYSAKMSGRDAVVV